LATINGRRPVIAKRERTVKKILYVIFFNCKGLFLQIPMPYGKTVTAKFYKNVSRKQKQDLSSWDSCMITHQCIRHASWLSFWNRRRFKSSLITITPKTLPLVIIFLFPKLKYHLSGRRYNATNYLGSAVDQYLVGLPVEEYCVKKWIDRVKRCVQVGGGRPKEIIFKLPTVVNKQSNFYYFLRPSYLNIYYVWIEYFLRTLKKQVYKCHHIALHTLSTCNLFRFLSVFQKVVIPVWQY
jgi:hypothetical protein